MEFALTESHRQDHGIALNKLLLAQSGHLRHPGPAPVSQKFHFLSSTGNEWVEPPLKKRRIEENDDHHLLQATANLRTRSDIPVSTKRLRASDRRAVAGVPGRPTKPLHPSRPTTYFKSLQKPASSILPPVKRSGIPIQAYQPAPPRSAPRYDDNCPSDFYFWKGNHPEDVLNEVTTRNGFYDKPQTNHSEFGTAKPSLWKSIKHKGGTRILSSLLRPALRERQFQGRILGNSTFKLPPRVTLTDTKREAWLSDLSNPSISLRRLSRTIPHGIRGKLLLEQCSKKSVPVPRAVWLAKCVGGNEIRAFKRKGAGVVFSVGGELKWIKEWTTSIEQFTDSVVTGCGEAGWKVQVNYATRLLQQLYSENLLDRGQYLDFIIKELGETDQDRIPSWLMFLAVHRHDLIANRRRGQRLVEVLLSHLDHLPHPRPTDLLLTIRAALVQNLQIILASAPECFINPEVWEKHGSLIQLEMIESRPVLKAIYTVLQERNLRLQHYFSQPSFDEDLRLRRTLLSLFDTLSSNAAYGLVARQCLMLAPEKSTMVQCCLHWCSNRDIHKQYKVYAATSLMSQWANDGIDIQAHILDCVSNDVSLRGCYENDIFKLVFELACSGHFSVTKYLQWLMAGGCLSHQCTHSLDWHVRLLLELPQSVFPLQSLSLRHSLLSKSDLRVRADKEIMDSVKATIADRLPTYLLASTSVVKPCPDVQLDNLSQSVRFEASRWLRTVLVPDRNMDDGSASEHSIDNLGSDFPPRWNQLTPQDFARISTVVLELGDYRTFSDFIENLLRQTNDETFLAVIDTVNCYVEVFIAVTAGPRLFHMAYNRVYAGEVFGHPKQILESLKDLGHRLPGNEAQNQWLEKQLVVLSGESMMTHAYSPISDTMVEAAHMAESSVLDELDQILATGTCMDERTLTRTFYMLTTRLERAWGDQGPVGPILGLLARLQNFDRNVFEQLTSSWLGTVLQMVERPSLSTALPPFICLRILSMRTILECVQTAVAKLHLSSHRLGLILEVISLVAGNTTLLIHEAEFRTYRMRHEQMDVLKTSPVSILRMLEQLTNSYISTSDLHSSLHEIGLDAECLQCLIHSALYTFAERGQASIPKGLEHQNALGKLLLDLGDSKELKVQKAAKFDDLCGRVNDFSLAACRFEITALLASMQEQASKIARSLVRAFTGLAQDTPLVQWSSYASLVSTFPLDNAKAVREEIDQVLLEKADGKADISSTSSNTPISGLFSILDASAFSVSASELLIIRRTVESIRTAATFTRQQLDSQQRLKACGIGMARIELLLPLILVYWPHTDISPLAWETKEETMVSLGFISLWLEFYNIQGAAIKLHDVLSFLIDACSHESRNRILGAFRSKLSRKLALPNFLARSVNTNTHQCSQNIHIMVSAQHTESPSRLNGSQTVQKPFSFRRWELMSDATPAIAENDATMNLALFGTQNSVL